MTKSATHQRQQSPEGSNAESPSGGGQLFSRWWETYAVRYAVGTVVGGILFYLICSLNDSLMPFLFSAQHGLETQHLALFAAYGFAFCYLASAPVLVLHAGRWALRHRSSDRADNLLRVVMTIAPSSIGAHMAYTETIKRSADLALLAAVVTALLTLILWLQVLAIGSSVLNGKALARFYARLSVTRQVSLRSGYVESYRHLREHGNAFLVVSLEICLALILYGAGQIWGVYHKGASADTIALLYGMVIFVWCAPACAVWILANSLEGALVRKWSLRN